MNNNEWLSIKNKMFAYTTHSTKEYQTLFNVTLKKNPKALQEARAIFPTGDSLYYASNSALSSFAIAYQYGLTEQKQKALKQDINKLINKSRKR